jgi:STE24 endopeptidase
MEQLIIAVFLSLFALEFLVEFGLNELNLRYVKGRQGEPNLPEDFRHRMNAEEYGSSVQYTLAKGRFERIGEIYGRLVVLVVLFSGLLPYLDRLSGELANALGALPQIHGIFFCFSVGAVFSVAALPRNVYSTFGIESRFGFNKMTFKLYVVDKLKALLLGMVLGAPFLFVVLWLMDRRGPYWWIWVFVFITSFQLLMIFIYPTIIAPLFNKFEPLKEGELRRRILELAEQLGFKTSGIFSMDGSKRSAHSNAYFTGLGKAKRIVLFDTLIEQMTVDQGVAVLAHEMGHYKMKHIRRMLVIQSVFILVSLYILSWLLDYEPLFSAFGFDGPSNHVALVLFSLLSGPATFFIGPLINFLSRKHEYEADRFAVQMLRDRKPMIDALVTLTAKNLSNLTPHPWYSAYHYSHPSPAERIRAIEECAV